MSSARGQRIEANCKIIWGDDSEYDFDVETDDNVDYACHVKKDFGDSFGPPLTMTSLCSSSEGAWAELDRMLALWATQVTRGTPMTKNEKLDIFGGPQGEHRRLLSGVMDAIEKRDGKPA